MIDWPKLFNNKGFTPLTPIVAPFAFLYGLGIRLRLIAFQTLLKPKSLPGTVVSIGNLTVGGTGKTPATCMLAEWALDEGYQVAVLSRGYAGKYKTKIFEVSDGSGIHGGSLEAGDEPYLLAKRLPGVPVVVSKNRYAAGLYASDKFKADFFILDDGFQHLALKRDFDLVLVDAANPFGNGRLLPWGPLREPLDQLKRAQAVIMTRSTQAPAIDDSSMMINKQFPGKPLFKGDHIPDKVVFPAKGTRQDIGFLKGKRVMAFAGIARPGRFKETLTQVGAEVMGFKCFRDHYIFNQEVFQNMIAEKKNVGADYLITTEKDWVRLEHLADEYPDLAYLTIRFELLSEKDRFFQMIKKSAEKEKSI